MPASIRQSYSLSALDSALAAARYACSGRLRAHGHGARRRCSGCRTLRPFGARRQNFASIGSSRSKDSFRLPHGTGATLPPVDEQVISMKLVTPVKGTIELSREKDPELFYLARCGLGGIGAIAEVTLQSVERPQLVEHTFVSNAGSGSLKTNILSTCGFHILTQLLFSNAILPQSGEPQN